MGVQFDAWNLKNSANLNLNLAIYRQRRSLRQPITSTHIVTRLVEHPVTIVLDVNRFAVVEMQHRLDLARQTPDERESRNRFKAVRLRVPPIQLSCF